MIFKRTEIIDSRREWMRQNLPTGQEGFVMQDLDGIAVTFKKFKRGKLFFESKWNVTEMPYAQQVTFREIDTAMHTGDKTYRGFFLVTWAGVVTSAENDRYVLDLHTPPKVNCKSISYADLASFFLGELPMACYFCKRVYP